MAKSHKTHPALTKARVAELTALGKKIDAEELDELKAVGKAVRTRYETMRSLIVGLKSVRLQRGLSLGEVGEKSGIGKANLSRLENVADPNPTIDTILRYADAIGVKISLAVDKVR